MFQAGLLRYTPLVSSVFETIGIPGVVKTSATASAAANPCLAVFGSIHGNEPCGLRAIERLRAELESGELQLQAGTLYLVHGNPRATEQHERHTRGGVDLNRVFDYRFVTELPAALWTYEHERALALRPLLDQLDVLLDLHSTTAPAPAFAISSALPASHVLAHALGLGYVTSGWETPELLGDKVVMAPLTQRGAPAVSVECGQHHEPESAAVAYTCLRRALHQLGMLPFPSLLTLPAVSCTRLLLRAAVKRPSSSFKFVKPLSSMQPLATGELIGCDEHLALSAQRACYVIMPNDTVAVGEDMLYIAQLSDEPSVTAGD
jgi:uncharacterized protein